MTDEDTEFSLKIPPRHAHLFVSIKTEVIDTLTRYNEPIPDEDTFNEIIASALIQMFANIQGDVREYNMFENPNNLEVNNPSSQP